MNKKYIILLITIILICACLFIFLRKENVKPMNKSDNGNNTSFDYKMINEINKTQTDNFMISPVSIAYALSMLKEGATENTKNELDNVLDNYKLPQIPNIKNRISLANLLFINNKYKKDINKSYIKLLQDGYNSDLMFDSFNSPEKINDWISDKTFKMIPKAIDSISPSTVLGLANAIAIDVKWMNEFECDNTREKEFTLINDEKMTTPMMHSSNDVTYIESDNAKGIIKDYKVYNTLTGEESYEEDKNNISLEYIAILPNTNIEEYKNTFNKEELNKLLSNKQYANNKLDIYYSLPKYTYDFDYQGFKEALINMGIKEMFTPVASFNKMKNEESKLQLYVSDAIHKSHIELNETGTKAAAVTVFMLKDGAMPFEEEKKIINISFNKPFIYIIKEKESDNIWFYGIVYKPMDFKDNPKCEVEYR